MFEKIRTAAFKIFEDSQLSLSRDYPGINKNIFLRELLSFLGPGVSGEQVIDSKIEHKISEFKNHVFEGIPFEYISGIAHFYGRDFVVGPEVLIPRQETEIIVEHVMSMKSNLPSQLDILDLCTGSGCLGLSIACELGAQVSKITLSDISKEAIKYSLINRQKLSYQFASNTEIIIQQSDLYQNINENFDIIVTNPPYIKKNTHLKNVHHQVYKYEPSLALFVDDKNYDVFFNTLFSGAASRLKNGGTLIMEGHEDEISQLVHKFKHLDTNDFSFEVLKDLSGRDRFIKALKGA